MGRLVAIRWPGKSAKQYWRGDAHDSLTIWFIGTGWCNRVSYGIMGEQFGFTRSQISGIVHRAVRPHLWHLRSDERKPPLRRRDGWDYRGSPFGVGSTYWDHATFEPYEKFKARKAQERAQR